MRISPSRRTTSAPDGSRGSRSASPRASATCGRSSIGTSASSKRPPLDAGRDRGDDRSEVSMARLDGKVAIVTGAASGIGRAAVERFAAEGARVLVADLQEDAAREVAAAVRARGLVAEACAVDVRDDAAVGAMVDRAVRTFGGL